MKKFAVIGLGKFGFNIAKALYEDGNEVVAIDNSKLRVQEIDSYSSQAIVMDATNRDHIKSLGLDMMDSVIVSTGTNISTSILICLYLQEAGVRNIIAKALDDDHAIVLKKVGASTIIHPEKDTALRVARGLTNPNIIDFIPLTGDYTLIQVEPLKNFVGKTLKDLNLRAKHNVYVIAIKETNPENFILVPTADFVIKESDILIMIGKEEDIGKLKG